VKPLAFVRTVTPPIFAVFRPTAVASAAPEAELLPAGALLGAVLGAVLGVLLDELLDELHAASAARPAVATETSSSARRRRLGTFSLSCDVIMSFPFSPLLSAFSFALRRALPRAERRQRVRLAIDDTGGIGPPCGAGCRSRIRAALTFMYAFALEYRSSPVVSSCPDGESIRAVSAAVGHIRPG
jgi:hypothetical protein